MFDRSPAHRHKEMLPVRVILDGKEPFDAAVYVKVDERLSDLLNDPRPFLPVRRQDGSVLMVAKSQIASIVEREFTEDERAAQTQARRDEARVQELDEPAREKSEDDVRRRAMELERLRAEIEAKRAAARAAAEQEAQAGGGSDEPASTEHSAPRGQESRENGPEEERTEAPPRPNRPRRAFDPYAMLRIRRGASVEEIKKAYKTRIKAVHPDIIASLDLDDDVVKAMHLTAQRINQAYDRIMRELARAEEQDADNPGAEKGAA